MSLRARLLVLAARWLARPALQRTADAAQARRDFARLAWLFRAPPHVLHLVDRGIPALHWISARRRGDDWVILYFHGGAYVSGSPHTHRGLMARIGRLTGLQVVAPEYRLAPEHPAPAAFDDAVAAHGRLMRMGYPPGRIILGGDSAGGGLALALLADLCRRRLAPAGLFALSPWTDLALTGASLLGNADCDALLPANRMQAAAEMVLGTLAPRDPRISPLYAAFDAPPPVLVQVGADEILLDDSRRMTAVLRAANGQVVLEEWPGCLHVWQMMDGYLPEARQALVRVAAFVTSLTTAPGGS